MALYISGNLVSEERKLLPLSESDSLITVERMNLKGAGEKFSACLQLVKLLFIYRYTYDGYINIYCFLFSMLLLFLAIV